uniref:Nucleoid-associated protein n=1 Tax=Siphoviridae sp. ct3pR10 TaxID=2826284 RepID=A0A8S5LX72_9CAUD|nr:MAG TPA: nucleoid-associated protein [Siphoviridae sp. ct3pR10]
MTTANRVVPDRYGVINIGKLKENLVTEVSLPAPGFSGGSYAVLLKRPKEEQPYPVSARHDGNSLVWTVQTADTAIAGMGKLECRWYGDNGEVAKSETYMVRIKDGLSDPTEAPEAWAGFMQQVSQDAGRAESAADNAAKTLKKLEDGIASGDFRGEKGEKGEKGDTGPQGPQGEHGPAGDTTAAAAAAEAAKQAAQEAQKAAEASAGSAAQAAESVGGLADDLEAAQKDIAKMKRAIQFQTELNKGQTWDFETDTQDAYQRQVPSGAKAGAVMAVGGKTVGWNQIADDYGKTLINKLLYFPKGQTITAGHKYLIAYDATAEQAGMQTQVIFYVNENGKILQAGSVSSTAAGHQKGIAVATKSGISTLADGIPGSACMYVYQPNGGVDNIKVIDLTLMFGSGNEPTDTSDPRIAQIEAYAAAHPEYNAGELVSALVDEVRVAGKNVAEPISAFSKSGVTMSVDKDGVYHFSGTATAVVGATSKQFALPSGTYTVSVESALPANVYVSISSILKLMVGPNTVKTGNWEGGTAYVYLYIGKGVIMDNVSIAFQVERGSTHTAYVPYQQPSTYPIPAAVQSLPGYGWSAGSVANTVERTDNGWQYVQRVGSVDLGTLDWYDGSTGTSARRMVTRQPPDNVKIPQESSVLSNLLCTKYAPVTPDDTWPCVKEGIALNKANAEVLVYDSAFATAESLAAFKAHVTGVPLYYELATPITTDITALMGDSLAPFAAEAGGSITMHHPKADEGFAIDVPAKIQYITKLSEVSANG